jgi:hypothetical protein
MARVPVLCAVLGLGAMVKLTEPLPDPVAPAITLIQVALLTAVQEHPVCAVTVVDTLPPAAGTDSIEGEIENEHPAGSCATVNVWFPIVSVPVRGLGVALAAALNATGPVPLPVAPLVTVSHDVSLLTAVQAQLAAVVTVVEPVPPAAVID